MDGVALTLDSWDMVARVGLATLLAGLIGIEREISGQPAGFRTHIVLALGATLFGLISIHGFAPFESPTEATNVRLDVTRVASQVAVGVGFLGAGAILKEGGSVRGLTTAASLWVTAAVGLAVGIGYETSAVAVTGATLISLVGLRSVRRVVRHRLARKEEQAVVRLLAGADPGLVVQAIHAVAGLDVRSVRIERDEETGTLVVEFNAVVAAGSLEEAVAPLAGLDGVDEVYVTGAL